MATTHAMTDAHNDPETLLYAELSAPACAPLYAALGRLYGPHFALDLARTCMETELDHPLADSFGYWARYHLQQAGAFMPPPPPAEAPLPRRHPQPQWHPIGTAAAPPPAECRYCPTPAEPVVADYSGLWQAATEADAETAPEPATEPPAEVQPPPRTAAPPAEGQPPPCAAEPTAETPPRPPRAAEPAASWSTVARGGPAKSLSILRRPKRFDGTDLFTRHGPRPVQTDVAEDDLRSLIDAAPRPLLVCEPSLAAVQGLLGRFGPPPDRVHITTTTRAAVTLSVGGGPTSFRAVLVHVSPQLLAVGVVQALVMAVAERGGPPVVAFCRPAHAPDVARVLGPDGRRLWCGAPPPRPPPAARSVRFQPPATDNTVVGEQRVLSDALAQHAARAPAIVVLAGSGQVRDAVTLRKAVRREDHDRLVSRLDVVTYRVHRPLPANALAALQSGHGRQSEQQAVVVVPVGFDAHWGTCVLPAVRGKGCQRLLLDTRVAPAASPDAPAGGRPDQAEVAARLALVEGPVVVLSPERLARADEARPVDAPQPPAVPAADFLHAASPPGSLLVEVLRLLRQSHAGAVDEASPALPLLVAWGLVRPGKARPLVVDDLYRTEPGAPASWAEETAQEDPVGSTPPRAEPALAEWALLAAEWFDDRAALLALVGARYAGDNEAALDQWLALCGVFNEMAHAWPGGVTVADGAQREAAINARARAVDLPSKGADDLLITAALLTRAATLDPQSVVVGSTSKQATTWCARTGVQAQALQQVAEGARAAADGMRLALRELRGRRASVFGAGPGAHPLDRFLPDAPPDAQPTDAATAVAFRHALALVGPVFAPASKRQHRCTCCPQTVRAVLEAPMLFPPFGAVVPIACRLQRDGARDVLVRSAVRVA